MSRRRNDVLAALAHGEQFRSAQDIHADMRAAGESVGLTTVYRALQALAEAGEVDVLRDDEGQAVYRRCATDEHHHHVVCRRCGATVEVEGPEVEHWALDVATRHGFVDVSHTLEVYGTCSQCASRAN
jgi:Fur family ferric uptake transcriptional regulator